MINFYKALELVDKAAIQLNTERIALPDACNRVLAEDVTADRDMPPFNKAAMDGYACKREDIFSELKVIATIKAGDVYKGFVNNGECVKIMTGARLPEGADCVIMVEQTKQIGESKICFTAEGTAPNYAPQGEDAKVGAVVLQKGILVKPQHIAVMATVGHVNPLVYKMPLINILTTGDEIVEPNQKPDDTKIRNSNGLQLLSQTKGLNVVVNYCGIVKDTPAEIEKAIAKSLNTCDVLILTGGVSMGDYDFVPDALLKNNIDIVFKEIAVKPGKPTVFGRRGNQFVFGLPGNPVSSFVIFELIVKPFVYKMMGHQYTRPFIKMPFGIDYKRRNAERTQWLPVFINDIGEVMPVEYHGSGHLHSVCYADGFVAVDEGVFTISKNQEVHVRLL